MRPEAAAVATAASANDSTAVPGNINIPATTNLALPTVRWPFIFKNLQFYNVGGVFLRKNYGQKGLNKLYGGAWNENLRL